MWLLFNCTLEEEGRGRGRGRGGGGEGEGGAQLCINFITVVLPPHEKNTLYSGHLSIEEIAIFPSYTEMCTKLPLKQGHLSNEHLGLSKTVPKVSAMEKSHGLSDFTIQLRQQTSSLHCTIAAYSKKSSHGQ